MDARPTERTALVWVVVAAIVALGGLAYTMARQSTHALDARATLARWFEPRDLPFGLALADASVLPRGDVCVRLAPAETPPEAERIEVPEAESGSPQEFDWSKVAIGAAGSAPREVLIVEMVLEGAAKELETLFEGGQNLNGDWASVPRNGARRVLERGKLPWGALAAPFVVEREFEKGGTFRDVLRVNLSSERTPRILIARWSRGFPASRERVEELLGALVPRE
ncbi:MAG: hypothetical protein IT454_23485 [Planctomycetes bacterium]|nr:hypothetical protein [Planctomycetota bacterium]